MRQPPITRTLLTLAACVWTVLWTLMALIEVGKTLHDPAAPVARIVVPIGTAFAAAVVWIVMWLGSRAFERIDLERPRRWFLISLAWIPVLGAAEFAALHGGRTAIFSALGMPYYMPPLQALIPFELIKVGLFYALWLGLAFGVKTFGAWQEQNLRLAQTQRALADAQLAQLKQQLQPHFLFNTLNTISSLMQTDIGRADKLIAQLADLLRSSLALGDRDLISLKDELCFVRTYAAIMRERFGDRVRVVWDIPDSLLSARVPALMLQPLVENAFRHGVEKSAGPQTVAVRAAAQGERLTLTVENSVGSVVEEPNGGVGLRNCRERLRLHYGSNAGLTLEARPGGGAIATLCLPCAP